MNPYLDYIYFIQENKKEIEKVNRTAWMFTKKSQNNKESYQKHFCFSFGRKVCVSLRYS